MPNIEVITPTTEIQAPSATVVRTDLKVLTESKDSLAGCCDDGLSAR